MFRKDGFTLLEMLVVLGIIAVIITVVTSSFSTAQKKARDSKRKTDLKAIQNSLEQYYSVCGLAYPTPVTLSGTSTLSTILCPNPVATILPVVPNDPKTTVPYVYTVASGGYTLCVPTRPAATPPVFEAETGSSYCLYNQQ